MSATEAKGPVPPVAKRVPHKLTVCGREWDDPYFWIRDETRAREDVLDIIKQENEYTEQVTKPLEPFRKSLYAEILSHLKEDDTSVPFRHGPFFYSKQTIKGKDYPVYRRGPLPDEAHQTEVILDVNALAEGFSFFDLDDYEPSTDHALLAYSADTSGYETFDIRIKDLKTGKLLDDLIPNTCGSIEWAADNSYLFYSTHDHAHRPYKLWRHKVGTDAKEDECLFTEEDEKFVLNFFKTRSEQYFFVSVSSAVTSEVHMIPAAETVAPKPQFKLFKARVQDVEYTVDHSGDYFWIVSNEEAKNFALWRAPVDKPERAHWERVLIHDPAVKIDFVECFKKYVVVFGRERGLTSVRVLYLDRAAHPPTEGKQEGSGSVAQPALYRSELLSFEEPVYTLGNSVNYVFDIDYLRFTYTSFVTPFTIYDYYFETKRLQLMKQTEVPLYDSSLYTSQRLFATASDGTQVPMSIVYRKDKVDFNDQSASYKTFVMGYGAYGISDDPEFSYQRLPILDRGVIFVVAHLRGGGEMGRLWYENGKYLSKKNTFTDFIAVLEHLIKIKVTAPQHLVITGGSAGGMLMGAVINMRPDLFKAVYTRVPFVDIVASVSDASIPLTVIEWEEWGNPNEEKFFEYMKSYSPYDNVRDSGEFPNIFITTGLNDYRVAYWEPMKWISKMRHVLASKRAAGQAPSAEPLLLLKCKMDSGHGGASGRYAYLEDKALEYTFVLDQLGLVPRDLN